jgi:hypothetical protein
MQNKPRYAACPYSVAIVRFALPLLSLRHHHLPQNDIGDTVTVSRKREDTSE